MSKAKRILLVENDSKDLELTLNALAGDPLAEEIAIARDGAEALDYLNRLGTYAQRPEGNPALVMLDLKMPKLDGTQVLRRLKADPLLRCVPVVILSSSRDDLDLDECYRLGANAYVVKPVYYAEFVQAVKRIVGFWAHVNEPPQGTVGRI